MSMKGKLRLIQLMRISRQFRTYGLKSMVASDEEAVKLMNDSPYGLTGHPESEEAFLKLEDQLECGTVFLNRCDYLDPALAWTGAKDSGRGLSLSKFGYDQLARVKSVHMKIKTA
ncbi:hypothetical protein B0H13DRAFT_1936512 [Mycena leptocephala]|nr:hypothetical protein B0H13DRAFT_1936512 [Mycena leptocephala]